MRIVFDPELAGEILVADAASYSRPWLVTYTMRDGLGPMLFTATGPDASAQRRLLAPVFARAHGDELAELMSSTIADELTGWRAGPISDLQGPLTDLTLRVAARALLGIDVTCGDRGHRLRSQFGFVIEWINHRFRRLFAPPAVIPTPRNRAMLRARSELRTIVHGVIADRRATGPSSMDVLQLLLDHQARTGEPSDDQIVNQCIGFLFAGHETTAATLAWALYSMAVAPDIQRGWLRRGIACPRLDHRRPRSRLCTTPGRWSKRPSASIPPEWESPAWPAVPPRWPDDGSVAAPSLPSRSTPSSATRGSGRHPTTSTPTGSAAALPRPATAISRSGGDHGPASAPGSPPWKPAWPWP